MAKKIIRLTESHLSSIVRSVVNVLINEDREGKNLKLARNAIRKYCKNATSEDRIWRILNETRYEIPFSRIYNCKYMCGVIRLVHNEGLETKEMDVINDILEVLLKDNRLARAYNGDFNGLYYEELKFKFYDYIQKLMNDEKNTISIEQNNDSQYSVVPINGFNDARQFSQYTEWCITKSEYDFEHYTNHGQKFYVCLKKGYEKVQPTKTEKYPLDEYGLTMIAVSVYLNGRLATCTTRWNEASMGNRSLNVQQISNLIGMNFYNVFKPNEQSK